MDYLMTKLGPSYNISFKNVAWEIRMPKLVYKN
jgi:hypothetical protein